MIMKMRCKDHEFDKPKSDILGAISEHVKIPNCPSGSKLCNVSIMRAKGFSEHIFTIRNSPKSLYTCLVKVMLVTSLSW